MGNGWMRAGVVAVIGLALTTAGCAAVGSSRTAGPSFVSTPQATSNSAVGETLVVTTKCVTADSPKRRTITITVPTGSPPTEVNWPEAWAEKFVKCSFPKRTVDGREISIADNVLAGEDDYNRSPVYPFMYCIPAGRNTQYNQDDRWKQYDEPVMRDVRKACPDHPWIEQWVANSKKKKFVPPPKPLPFHTGRHERIGKDIEPGVYVTTGANSCYWELVNRQGDIIDNYFSNARRVEVTIPDDAYEFYSTNCGMWRPVE